LETTIFWSWHIYLKRSNGSRWHVSFMNRGSLMAPLDYLSIRDPHLRQHLALLFYRDDLLG
jgi:hypothetical protein